jgi:hypothetical protein
VSRLAYRHEVTDSDRISETTLGVAAIPADVIADVCEAAWQKIRFFPKPAELHEIARQMLAADTKAGSAESQRRVEMMREKNRAMMAAGDRVRWNLNADHPRLLGIDLDKNGPHHRICDGDGGFIEATFDHESREWRWPQKKSNYILDARHGMGYL